MEARERSGGAGLAPAFVALLLATALPELVLTGADLGLWGSRAWRVQAYGHGAFWAGLLGGWQANFPGQAVTMFVTYGFLHAGMGHLVGNLLTLVPLARAATAWLGTARALLVYAASVVGGALAYAALSTSVAPMVGASGAAFGLAGAAVAHDWRERGRPARTLAALLGLVGLNLAMWVLAGGQLAWQTHAGGAAAGGLAALALAPPQAGGAAGTASGGRRPSA